MIGSTDYFSENVLNLLAQAEGFEKPALPLSKDTWAGIMQDTQGGYYAVFASGQGTPYFTEVQYISLSKDDDPKLWSDLMSHVQES